MNSQRFRAAAATASKSARSIRLNSKDRAQYILLMMLKKKIALVTGRSQGLMNNTFRTPDLGEFRMSRFEDQGQIGTGKYGLSFVDCDAEFSENFVVSSLGEMVNADRQSFRWGVG